MIGYVPSSIGLIYFFEYLSNNHSSIPQTDNFVSIVTPLPGLKLLRAVLMQYNSLEFRRKFIFAQNAKILDKNILTLFTE